MIQEVEKVETKIKKVKISQVPLAVKMKEGCQLKAMKKEKAALYTKET